jgi:kinesin family protein 18/19
VCLQQTITLLSSTATNTAEVQAHSTQASRAEMDQLREQLLEAFRSQMEIRRSLMELDNSNMEIQMDTSKHLLTIAEYVS